MKPETMSSTPTAAERAEKRLQRLDKETVAMSIDKYDSFATRGAYRNGYATCIREEVEPLEEEIKLIEIIGGLSFKPGRRPYELVAELAASRGDALARIDEAEAENAKLRALVQELVNHMQDGMEDYGEYPCFLNGLEEAKSQGFTPTNTTEG